MGLFSSKKLFTLVFNMKISGFNLIIYNFCNWSYSSTLISCYAIIFSRALNCSISVFLSSCRVLNFCLLVALYGLRLGTYGGTELRYLEGPYLLFTWRSGWIHNWYIWWYRARIFGILDWRNCRRQIWGPLDGCLTCISCWTCNWF